MKKITLVTGCTLLSAPVSCFAQAYKQPAAIETWIAFLPVIFFALLAIVMAFKLKKAAISLKDVLAEKDDTTVPPAPAPPTSVSRLIAFLTAMVALILGVCIGTFYMYAYFSNPAATINISNLTNVIWGLGIGVIPYGFNKVSSAIK